MAYQKRSDGNWYSGCSCQGLDPKNMISVPEGSVELLFNVPAPQLVYGPVTGLEYHVTLNYVAIDIDARDEQGFRDQHIAQNPSPTMRGLLTRTGKVKNVTEETTI